MRPSVDKASLVIGLVVGVLVGNSMVPARAQPRMNQPGSLSELIGELESGSREAELGRRAGYTDAQLEDRLARKLLDAKAALDLLPKNTDGLTFYSEKLSTIERTLAELVKVTPRFGFTARNVTADHIRALRTESNQLIVQRYDIMKLIAGLSKRMHLTDQEMQAVYSDAKVSLEELAHEPK